MSPAITIHRMTVACIRSPFRGAPSRCTPERPAGCLPSLPLDPLPVVPHGLGVEVLRELLVALVLLRVVRVLPVQVAVFEDGHEDRRVLVILREHQPGAAEALDVRVLLAPHRLHQLLLVLLLHPHLPHRAVHQPLLSASDLAHSNTLTIMSGVSFPVNVFCWLGW